MRTVLLCLCVLIGLSIMATSKEPNPALTEKKIWPQQVDQLTKIIYLHFLTDIKHKNKTYSEIAIEAQKAATEYYDTIFVRAD